MNSSRGPNSETPSGAVAGPAGGVDVLFAIERAIQAITDKLGKPECEKGAITDLVRLLQLRKELDDETPRRVTARWIEDSCDTSID